MKTADYQFHVRKRLIPFSPPELHSERREYARMIVLHRAQRRIEYSRFRTSSNSSKARSSQKSWRRGS